MGKDAPWAPPLVEMNTGQPAFLLAWDHHECDGSWHAWVSWIHTAGAPPLHAHKVVSVDAASLRPLDTPEAFSDVPRRILGNDGLVRPWT
jgi:hypothetical protein